MFVPFLSSTHARQEDTCWRCGVLWVSEVRPRNALRVIRSAGAGGFGARQAELDATDDVVAALARWSAVRDQPRPALAQEAT
jgi:hypothetical protein